MVVSLEFSLSHICLAEKNAIKNLYWFWESFPNSNQPRAQNNPTLCFESSPAEISGNGSVPRTTAGAFFLRSLPACAAARRGPTKMIPDDFWESIFADITNKVWKFSQLKLEQVLENINGVMFNHYYTYTGLTRRWFQMFLFLPLLGDMIQFE